MKKNNTLMSVTLAFIMTFGFSLSTFANSSWRWITASRPYDVLPFEEVERQYLALFEELTEELNR